MTYRPELNRPAGSTAIKCKDTGGVVFTFINAKGRLCAMAYAPRAKKRTSWRYYFPNAAAREKRIRETIKGWREAKAETAQRKAKRNAPHSLEVGHVLVSTWGYEQTNVDFYEVTKVVSDRTVEIREIGSRITETIGWAMGKRLPDIGNYTSQPMRKRVDMSGGDASVTIRSFASASLWSGRPVSFTSYA